MSYSSKAKKNANARAYYRDHRAKQLERVKANNKARRDELRRIITEAKAVPCADCGTQYNH